MSSEPNGVFFDVGRFGVLRNANPDHARLIRAGLCPVIEVAIVAVRGIGLR